ncbi:hypothetical protein CEXT_653541 [Caerostris extrusa]|uniref:Uncharacterized protein n=1 Tax=Caerostris extrusa TaxID=172846 RepID=A0AAV4N8P5_CAEEX|nr:hypothetical protein CEXT_653541 [Caerostris extrusa]
MGLLQKKMSCLLPAFHTFLSRRPRNRPTARKSKAIRIKSGGRANWFTSQGQMFSQMRCHLRPLLLCVNTDYYNQREKMMGCFSQRVV